MICAGVLPGTRMSKRIMNMSPDLGRGAAQVSLNIDLSGKVTIVTGGSRGLGLAIVRGLAQAGATVAVASRKLDACQQIVTELIAAGGRASAHAFDAGRWEDCDRLFAEVTDRWGGAGVLVNNVGK